jgi:hypothetical protein
LNHAVASLSADFWLTDHLTLRASAAYNWAINRETDFVRYADDEILRDFFWGGLSVSVGKNRERSSSRQEPWEVTFGTSVWATAMDGSTSMGGDSFGGVRAVDDSIDQVHTGLSIEANRGAWSVLLDGSYVSFGAETAPLLSIFDPTPVEVRMASVHFAAGYRVLDCRCATVDLLAVVRYHHLETEYQFNDPESRKLNWLDPSVGVRARMKLLEKLDLSMRAEFGGFGIGSDHYWQVDLGLEYKLTDHLSVEVRYQHQEVDYTQDDNEVEFSFKGPKIGASYRF